MEWKTVDEKVTAGGRRRLLRAREQGKGTEKKRAKTYRERGHKIHRGGNRLATNCLLFFSGVDVRKTGIGRVRYSSVLKSTVMWWKEPNSKFD